MVKICIIGAGIVGLSTARVLLETQPGIQVTIIADKFSPNTTGNVAAGIYMPDFTFTGPTKEITEKWLKDSLAYMKDMVHNHPEEAKIAGVVQRTGYVCATELVKNQFLSEVLDEHRPCTEEEIKNFPRKYTHGSYLTTYLIDSSYHLPYLTHKIKSMGGTFQKRSIRSFDEINEDFDIICNCTGLGSRELCNDLLLAPLRGQVFKVRAPWINTFVYADYESFVIPGVDLVTVGTTRQLECYNKEVDVHDGQGIWDRCVKIMPSLKDAQVVKQLIGWRPHRPIVRVEKETIKLSNGRYIKVVHNYGHGANGVMSAPGTAMHAASLVKEFIQTTSKL